ncbi:MAG: PDZ domain-containing protein [Frankiales bacterium]|nr:PDZ domain-containing protein [Frankiales bacterium]
MSQQRVPLEGSGRVADVILVSAGPGLTPGEPVVGGTQDVQILSWDAIAKRWNLAFDAADKVLDSNLLGAVPPKATALLDQSHPVGGVVVRPVSVHRGQWLATIYGYDAYFNHPPGFLAFIAMDRQGSARIVYYDTAAGLSQRTITGAPGEQRVTVTAELFTVADPACCPARMYTQVLGAGGDYQPSYPSIEVLSDDRPWLGAYVANDPESRERAVVVGTADGSPASSVLRVTDRLMSVVGAPIRSTSSLGPAVLDQLARHRPGDSVTLRVLRDGHPVQLQVTLASYKERSSEEDLTPKPAIAGFNGTDAPAGQTPGFIVSYVTPGGPADAAGLSPGDDVVAVGGVRVRGSTDVQAALVGESGVGVSIRIERPDGSRVTAQLTPVDAPSNDYNVLSPSEI